jgi:hypothetical protein
MTRAAPIPAAVFSKNRPVGSGWPGFGFSLSLMVLAGPTLHRNRRRPESTKAGYPTSKNFDLSEGGMRKFEFRGAIGSELDLD